MSHSATSEAPLLDLFVIGGGINGAGIANDAAGRGLKVALCEQDDFAAHTSSASSKLIHGGLRYLEYKEFRLVKEALHEREVLLRKAPHIVWPMRFILPHQAHLRPAWMLRAGLFLYDHLSSRATLPASKTLHFKNEFDHGKHNPLVPSITKGFEYSDCWVDDARMVVLNVLQAQEKGAEILARTRCLDAQEEDGQWHLYLEDTITGERFERRAKAIANAAGAWVETFIRQHSSRTPRLGIKMIKGSHLIMPRINTDDRAYILQNSDKRIVFVLPYQREYSIVGTTDLAYKGDPSVLTINDEEVDYLINVLNEHFKQTFSKDQIITTYSGVRPLCDDESADPSAMTRDYTLDLDGDTTHPPLLAVYGGKITTFRKLAESAMSKLAPFFPHMGPAWTAEAVMPGGDIPDRDTYIRQLKQRAPWLDDITATRFATSYGRLCEKFLKPTREEMGEAFGAGMTAAEIDYLIDHEWAREKEDVIWRRTKMKLHLTDQQQARIADYVGKRTANRPESLHEGERDLAHAK
ncbi:Aerobic glycerol-3-phosphate dehydrogenase [Halomonadaceae bacterium LMG 33818]|uniref:glycerol-3-phosphate dehydrogenase n=1 Tax=Cernens ardua TaxID=3402176 RepID=UPI003EDC5EB2